MWRLRRSSQSLVSESGGWMAVPLARRSTCRGLPTLYGVDHVSFLPPPDSVSPGRSPPSCLRVVWRALLGLLRLRGCPWLPPPWCCLPLLRVLSVGGSGVMYWDMPMSAPSGCLVKRALSVWSLLLCRCLVHVRWEYWWKAAWKVALSGWVVMLDHWRLGVTGLSLSLSLACLGCGLMTSLGPKPAQSARRVLSTRPLPGLRGKLVPLAELLYPRPNKTHLLNHNQVDLEGSSQVI